MSRRIIVLVKGPGYINEICESLFVPHVTFVAKKRRYLPKQNEERRYTLLNNVEDEGSDAENEIFLQHLAQELFMEKEVQPGDTLQTLALQFNCPVAELKRLNNIHRDNEIFARRVVRVPVKPISLLTRKLPEVHVSVSNKESISDEQTYSKHNNSSNIDVSIDISQTNSEEDQAELTRSYGETVAAKTIGNIHQCQTDDDSDPEREDNVAEPLLSAQDIETAVVNPMTEHNSSSPYSCSGADWGLSWSQLLICSLLLGFAGPILYVLYITENDKAQKQQ